MKFEKNIFFTFPAFFLYFQGIAFAIDIELIEDLVLEYVKTFNEDHTFYRWQSSQSSKNLLRAGQLSEKTFEHFANRSRIDAAGSGFYIADSIDSSSEYGETILEVRIKKGTKYVNLKDLNAHLLSAGESPVSAQQIGFWDPDIIINYAGDWWVVKDHEVVSSIKQFTGKSAPFKDLALTRKPHNPDIQKAFRAQLKERGESVFNYPQFILDEDWKNFDKFDPAKNPPEAVKKVFSTLMSKAPKDSLDQVLEKIEVYDNHLLPQVLDEALNNDALTLDIAENLKRRLRHEINIQNLSHFDFPSSLIVSDFDRFEGYLKGKEITSDELTRILDKVGSKKDLWGQRHRIQEIMVENLPIETLSQLEDQMVEKGKFNLQIREKINSLGDSVFHYPNLVLKTDFENMSDLDFRKLQFSSSGKVAGLNHSSFSYLLRRIEQSNLPGGHYRPVLDKLMEASVSYYNRPENFLKKIDLFNNYNNLLGVEPTDIVKHLTNQPVSYQALRGIENVNFSRLYTILGSESDLKKIVSHLSAPLQKKLVPPNLKEQLAIRREFLKQADIYLPKGIFSKVTKPFYKTGIDINEKMKFLSYIGEHDPPVSEKQKVRLIRQVLRFSHRDLYRVGSGIDEVFKELFPQIKNSPNMLSSNQLQLLKLYATELGKMYPHYDESRILSLLHPNSQKIFSKQLAAARGKTRTKIKMGLQRKKQVVTERLRCLRHYLKQTVN